MPVGVTRASFTPIGMKRYSLKLVDGSQTSDGYLGVIVNGKYCSDNVDNSSCEPFEWSVGENKDFIIISIVGSSFESYSQREEEEYLSNYWDDYVEENKGQFLEDIADKTEEDDFDPISMNYYFKKNINEARVTPVGIGKIQLPDPKWEEFPVDKKPDLEENFDVESYGAPMEGWDTDHYDFVNIMSTPKYDAWADTPTPLETKYFIRTIISFSGTEDEEKRYDSLNDARKRAVEVMKDIMKDWDEED